MGLCYRCSTVTAEMPNVRVEKWTDGEDTITRYRTPAGDVCTRSRTRAGRIADSLTVEIGGLIKTVDDYDPVIFMLDDTIFPVDNKVYFDSLRDIGRDGIFRDWALDHEASPWAATRRYFGEIYGLEQWVYHQRDHPDHFAKLVEAQWRRDERRLQVVANSPAEFMGFGWVEGLWPPKRFQEYELPFYKKWVPYLQNRGKILALHCDVTRNLKSYKDVIRETGVDVVEAFTPPPISDLSLKEAREAWPGTIIWVNFPETIFYSGVAATKEYTVQLLRSSAPGDRLVLGFTEMGTWGATDDETDRCFKEGTLAVMAAIEEAGVYPIQTLSRS